ncbi:hypothetical protein C9439_03735 [archaeon SCG-AAA382B04]|nr:hypothetical protein C9439_03735 [archaeon SCG-AAA382B04]
MKRSEVQENKMKQIPSHKKKHVAKLYIKGHTYKEITDEVGISEGSVRNIIKQLMRGKLGLDIQEEAESLREVGKKLKKTPLSLEQATVSFKLLEQMQRLDVDPDELDKLVEVYEKIEDPEFVESSKKLLKLDREHGSYQEATEKYEEKAKELEDTKNQLDKRRKEREQIESTFNEQGLSWEEANALVGEIPSLQNERDELESGVEDLGKQKQKQKQIN